MVEDNFSNNTNLTQFVLVGEDGKVPEIVQSIAKIIQGRIDSFNLHRRSLMIETKANISYLVGEQKIELVGDNIVPSMKERTIDCTINVLLPAVQKDIAVATSRPPAFDIVPAGSDDDDKATAIVARKGYKHIMRMNGEDLKRGDTVLWYDLSGVGWRKTIWNPNAKVIGINPPEKDELGQVMPQHVEGMEVGSALMEGEIEIIAVPTSQLIYDFRSDDLTKLFWIIHAKRVSSSWVLNTFGQEIHDKLSAQFSQDGNSREKEFETNIMNRFTDIYQTHNDGSQRMVTPKQFNSNNIKLDSDRFIDYYEYWAKPTKENPTGTYAIMLGTQLVYHMPYPIESYPHGELPFTPAAPIKIDGATSAAICRVSQTRPLQRKLNRLGAQIDENIDVVGNAVIFTPRGAKLRHKTMDNGAGNFIEYDGPMNKPHREPGVPMNSQVFNYFGMIKNAIDEIFAFHGAMKGQPPKNIDSGQGIQALQSSDIEHLGPIVAGFERADQTVLFQALTLMAANYEQGRMINVVGSDYEWTLHEWDPKQMQGKFNVIVKHRSSMPIDRDAEAKLAFDLWGSGLLGDPQDPSLRVWVMNQMHFGNKDVILQKHSKQLNFAKMEFSAAVANLKSLNVPEGVSKEQLAELLQQYTFVPSINPFDDHMIHVQCHNEYMIDKYWDFKKSGNPLYIELLNNMGNHITEHQQIIIQKQEAQYQKQLLAQMLLKKATPQQILLSKQKPNNSNSNSKG